jgi:deoxyribodipyrimidine photolyase
LPKPTSPNSRPKLTLNGVKSKPGSMNWCGVSSTLPFFIISPKCWDGPFREDYAKLSWRTAPEDLAAWQNGQTGYPVVDACMRQLLATGWMHNRGRMIVASFLTKDLLINWQEGEAWFMHNLVDGDPAANNGGWQWSAGTGTDAAPYFRIFQPHHPGL